MKAPIAPASKPRALAHLKSEIESCAPQGKRLVLGEGNTDARLAVVGEAPGRDEELAGRPFAGRAGRMLDELLAAVSLRRGELWVTNLVKWRPTREQKGKVRDRPPDSREIGPARELALKELQIIHPRILLCMGNLAARALIDKSLRIGTSHGIWYSLPSDIQAMATFHPAYVVRWGGRQGKMWEPALQDLKKVKERYDALASTK